MQQYHWNYQFKRIISDSVAKFGIKRDMLSNCWIYKDIFVVFVCERNQMMQYHQGIFERQKIQILMLKVWLGLSFQLVLTVD